MLRGVPRAFTLDEVLTEGEIAHALRLYRRGKKKFHANCLAQIVEPAMARITEVLGPCSARFVAYGIEYRCLKYRKTADKSVMRRMSKYNLGRMAPKRGKRNKRNEREVDRTRWEIGTWA